MDCKEILDLLEREDIKDLDTLEDLISIYDSVDDEANYDEAIGLCHKIQIIQDVQFKNLENSEFAEMIEQDIKKHISLVSPECDAKKSGIMKKGAILQLLKRGTTCKYVQLDKHKKHILHYAKFLENFSAIYQIEYKIFEKIFYSENDLKKYLKDKKNDIAKSSAQAVYCDFEEYLNLLKSKSSQYIEDDLKRYKHKKIEETIELLEYAFSRDIDSKIMIAFVESAIETFMKLASNVKFITLKAKLFSNIGKDQDALDLLIQLPENEKDGEIFALMGASEKRKALHIYDITNQELLDYVIEKLKNALTYYERAYEKAEDNNKYYPLINIFNLEMILAKLQNVSNDEIAGYRFRNEFRMQNSINKNSIDTWEQLTYLTYLIYKGEFNQGLEYFYSLDKENFNNFQLRSFTRQLSLYLPFAPNEEQIQIANFMDKIKK